MQELYFLLNSKIFPMTKATSKKEEERFNKPNNKESWIRNLKLKRTKFKLCTKGNLSSPKVIIFNSPYSILKIAIKFSSQT